MSIYVKVIEDGVLKKYIPGYKHEEIIIPDNVHTIGENCFNPFRPEPLPVDNKFELQHWDAYMKATTIIIPDNIKHIQRYAFIQIPNLESFLVQKGCTAAKVYDDALISTDGKNLIFCPPKKYGDFSIPYGVETIWENAFEASVLSDVLLPNTVTEIEDDAFANSEINNVFIPPSVTKIGKRVFRGCHHLNIKAIKGSYAINYALENGIYFREIKEEDFIQKAANIKKPFFASYRTEFGLHYRRKNFGYPYKWNGILFFSETPEPYPGIWLTEAQSGVSIEYGKLCRVYENHIDLLLSKLSAFGKVRDLPVFEDVYGMTHYNY